MKRLMQSILNVILILAGVIVPLILFSMMGR